MCTFAFLFLMPCYFSFQEKPFLKDGREYNDHTFLFFAGKTRFICVVSIFTDSFEPFSWRFSFIFQTLRRSYFLLAFEMVLDFVDKFQ